MILAMLLGFTFGFVGAIPVAGPVSALVLHRGIRRQYAEGFQLALGASLAEGIYVALAAFGFHTWIASSPWIGSLAVRIAACILIALGIHFIRSRRFLSRPRIGPSEATHSKKGGPFWLGFSISLINPTLMVTWTTILTTLHPLRVIPSSWDGVFALAFGAALGIAAWFRLMLRMLRQSDGKLRPEVLERFLLAIGAVLIVFGLYQLIRG